MARADFSQTHQCTELSIFHLTGLFQTEMYVLYLSITVNKPASASLVEFKQSHDQTAVLEEPGVRVSVCLIQRTLCVVQTKRLRRTPLLKKDAKMQDECLQKKAFQNPIFWDTKVKLQEMV